MIGSLGAVLVTTPGTPVRATANEEDPTARVAAQTVRFQVLPTNTGKVTIGLGSMYTGGTVAGENVLHVLPPPADPTAGPFTEYEATIHNVPSGLNVADFYIDAEIAQDGVVVSYLNQ